MKLFFVIVVLKFIVWKPRDTEVSNLKSGWIKKAPVIAISYSANWVKR